MTAVRPNPQVRRAIAKAVQADTNLCWTCGTCESECPINLFAGRLHPRKIVWMANLGFLDELLDYPELWYCMACKRCEQVCPNLVKPCALIAFLKEEAVRHRKVTRDQVKRIQDFASRFQRVRWHTVKQCFHGEAEPLSEETWRECLDTPVDRLTSAIHLGEHSSKAREFISTAKDSAISSCFTCSECSCACPLTFERSVFDPQWIFRMANYGLYHELLTSPSIWLCIECGRCTEACTQLVKGREFIPALRNLAVELGFVDPGFVFRLSHAYKLIYARYTEEIDRILDLPETLDGVAVPSAPPLNAGQALVSAGSELA